MASWHRTVTLAAFTLLTACDAAQPPGLAGRADAQVATTTPNTQPDANASDAQLASDTTTSPRTQLVEALAVRVLTAWKNGDVTTLAGLTPPDKRSLLLASAPGTARVEWLFGAGAWRMRTATTWDGKLGVTRFDGARALVEVAALDDGQLALVDLREATDGWAFYGLTRAPRGQFEAFGALE